MSGYTYVKIFDLGQDLAKNCEIYSITNTHSEHITGLIVSPNSKNAISVSYDNTLKFYDLETCQEPITRIFKEVQSVENIDIARKYTQKFGFHKKKSQKFQNMGLSSCAYSKDGDLIAIGFVNGDVKVIDSKSMVIVYNIPKAHENEVYSVGFWSGLGNKRKIISLSKNGMKIHFEDEIMERIEEVEDEIKSTKYKSNKTSNFEFISLKDAGPNTKDDKEKIDENDEDI